MRRGAVPANYRVVIGTLRLLFTNDSNLETRYEQQWVLDRLPFETAWVALMMCGTLAELFVRSVLRQQLQRLVTTRWALLTAELVTCMLLYLVIIQRGKLASCHMVKRCFQDIVLVPLCTLIISPLIMRRQLWLSATILTLTAAIVTSTGGLASSIADVVSNDATCTVGGPLLWLAHGLDMVWRWPTPDAPTLRHTAAPLLLFLHIVLVFFIPLVTQYTAEFHTRCRFLLSVGVQPVYRGPQGRLLRYLLIVAALSSPAALLLLWRGLHIVTGAAAAHVMQ